MRGHMKLAPIKRDTAGAIFAKHTEFRGSFDIVICAMDDNKIHGVIALTADGQEFALAHLWTDANAQVGSLLYGAAWRTAKAMGYTQITI